jgi:hypothetical protein
MNDPSHNFVAIDPGDCPRCIYCDVRSGSRHAEPVCPGDGPAVIDHVPGCRHDSIARCEQTIPWCTDCHQYIDTTTRRASTAPTLARDGKPYFPASPHREAVELRFDADTERFYF